MSALTGWYTYRQNNSGGYFDGPVDVIVWATSPEEADRLSGIDFDGQVWCECCGKRWYRADGDWDIDSTDPNNPPEPNGSYRLNTWRIVMPDGTVLEGGE